MQEFKPITEEQLKRIQPICREWLSNPTTNRNSRLTIPSDAVLPRAITVEIKAILTFDNVMITSVVDAETGVCYTKLISKSGEPETFIDATLEMESVPGAVATGSLLQPSEPSAANPVANAPGTDSAARTRSYDDRSMAFETNSTDEKFLLCTNGTVLGYSALEKTKSENHRKGRFFPSDDYFEFAEIFEEFPQAENDCMDANVHEAYGLTYDNASEFRKKFNDLCERIDALKLYVVDDSGKQVAVTELKLEDLSRFYGDESERWLHVDFETPLQNREP